MSPCFGHDIFTGISPPFQRVQSFICNTFKHVLNIFNDFFIVHFSSQFLHFLTFSHLNYVRNHLLATHLANLGRGFCLSICCAQVCVRHITEISKKGEHETEKKRESCTRGKRTNEPTTSLGEKLQLTARCKAVRINSVHIYARIVKLSGFDGLYRGKTVIFHWNNVRCWFGGNDLLVTGFWKFKY